MDNTNHDLVHTLSVRLDAGWHDSSYRKEVACESCQLVFDRLGEFLMVYLELIPELSAKAENPMKTIG